MRLIEIEAGGGDPELVADRCWQAGAAGIWDLGNALRVGVEDPQAPSLMAALADLGPVDVTEREAVTLVQREMVIGPADDPLTLVVPATVFGDGRHPTTSGCMDLLASLVEAGTTVLDVGCGSGALSVVAGRLGGTVRAIDLDPEAVATTAANAAANATAVDASTTPLAGVDGSFDVVVANISAATIADNATELRRHTRPGGHLVVSGLLAEQSAMVEAAVGWTVERRLERDGWVTLQLRSP